MPFPTRDFIRHHWTESPEGTIRLDGSAIGTCHLHELIRDPQLLDPERYEGTPFGLQALRQIIAQTYNVPFEEVLISSGVTQGNFAALAALTSPGDLVLVEHPTFEGLSAAVQALGLRFKPFPRPPENGSRPDLTVIEECLNQGAKAVLLTDPMNPTGLPMPDEDFAELEQLCQAKGAALIVDEIYQDFEHLHHPLSHRRGGHTTYATGGLSKVYGLNHLRIGWLLGPKSTLEKAWAIQETTSGGAARVSQALALFALKERQQIIPWIEQRLKDNYGILERFKGVCPHLIWGDFGKGSLYFPRLPEAIPGDEFVTKLALAGVRVAPGRFFNYAQGFRLGLGVTKDDLRRGLSRIGRLAESWR